MPRKGRATRRNIAPDPVFGSKLVNRFVNKLLVGGKKSTAERIFYGALQRVHDETGRNPLDVLAQAVRNCTPHVEVRGRRVGGATYQVPMEVRPDRQLSLAIRWLVQHARARGERSMTARLANELMDASNNQGNAVRKKDEMHRMAEANRAFAHYRW
jgi:small subunit ribosomal protein S7